MFPIGLILMALILNKHTFRLIFLGNFEIVFGSCMIIIKISFSYCLIYNIEDNRRIYKKSP